MESRLINSMRKKLVEIYLAYIRFFAKIQLRKINPKIIGIGGASGKSSVSYLTSLILNEKYSVKESNGKNSETGIPLNILGIEIENYNLSTWIKIIFLVPLAVIFNNKKYDYYVCEMGIDSPYPPKNMDYLLKILKPDLATLTNINIEHSQNFDIYPDETDEIIRKEKILNFIALEEIQLLNSVPSEGFVVLNNDDSLIKEIKNINSNKLSLSSDDRDSDFYIKKVITDIKKFEITFVFDNKEYTLKINQPLPIYFSQSFLISISLAKICGIEIESSIKILEEKFKLPAGRFSVLKGIKNSVIVDSSYNSSFEPTEGAIKVVSKIAKKRKVAILGDMRELGFLSRIQHHLIAESIIENLDFVILMGPMMNEFVVPVLKENNFKFKSFNSFEELDKSLLDLIESEDTILIKGSQNTLFLERAVEKLLENKIDVKKLPRRGEYWDKIRQKSQ